MAFAKFFLCLYLSILLVYAIPINLIITPLNIKLGLTSQLDVNCSVPPGPPDSFSILAIIITHSKDTVEPQFVDLATVSMFEPQAPSSIPDAGAVYNVSGTISKTEDSYLSLHWNRPNISVAGLYRCIAFTQVEGNDMDISAEVLVTHEKPDADDLFTELDAIRGYLQAAVHNATDIWEKRLDDARSAVFVASALVIGRMYHLSKYNNFDLDHAEAMCRYQGGFVAEIDSEQELISIKDFFGSVHITNDTLVLIAGADQAKEGLWQFTRKPIKTVPYLSWAPGHPSNDSSNNNDCLALDAGQGLSMVDVPCSRSEQNFRSRFLCEVPHAPFAAD